MQNEVVGQNAVVGFKVGDRLVARVRKVCAEGVYLNVDGAADAMMSPKRFGIGARRNAMLGRIRVGSTMEATVRKYHEKTRQLVLDPTLASVRSLTAVQRKPSYELLAQGTTFLVDGANLVGAIGPENVAHAFAVIRGDLEKRGYKAVIFLEHRCYVWCLSNQSSEERKEALRSLVRSGGVSLVEDEADCTILQCARSIPSSVCLTNDSFADYREVFGDLVGTSRVRRFSTVKLADKTLISVTGLGMAIEIPVLKDEPLVAVAPMPVAAKTEKPRPNAVTGHAARLALGHSLLNRGEVKRAFRCFDTLVRKNDPDGYRALANAYANGEGVDPDGKRAKKYEKLARRLATRNRELARREARTCALLHRSEWSPSLHLSARRLEAQRLSVFGERHKANRAYARRCRTQRKPAYRYAA